MWITTRHWNLLEFYSEVQKLKEASKQIKYKLENLDRKQKRILVDLFVDKVEMTRKKEGKRWRIWADITFRFNPTLFSKPKDMGRTAKGLKLKDKTKKIPSEKVSGGPEGSWTLDLGNANATL